VPEVNFSIVFRTAPALKSQVFRQFDYARSAAFRAFFDAFSRVEIAYAFAAVVEKALRLSE
jgi:hypothetical protein